MKLPKLLTTVTPFSKFLALSMLVIFPVLAFFFGMYYEYTRTMGPVLVGRPIPGPTNPFSSCPMDIKQCPDGTYVGRREPNCEFASCPAEPPGTENWQTFTDNRYFFLRYPPTWTVKKDYNFQGDIMIYNPKSLTTYQGNGGSTITFPTTYVDLLSIGPSQKSAVQIVTDYTNQWKQDATAIQSEQTDILGNTLILYDNQGEGSYGRTIAYSHGNILALFNTSIKHLADTSIENHIIESFRFLK